MSNRYLPSPTAVTTPPQPKGFAPLVSSELVVAVAALFDKFPSLKQLTVKYSLTPFKVVSAPLLQTLDREISSNPDILEEGCSFLEIVNQMSVFYTETTGKSYLDEVFERMLSLRTPPSGYKSEMSLAPEVMSEYFLQNDAKQTQFFDSNPYVFGLYLFVLFWTMTQFKEEQ